MWVSLPHSFYFGFWVHRYIEIKDDIKNKPTSNKLITLNLESPENVEPSSVTTDKGIFSVTGGAGTELTYAIVESSLIGPLK